jgi:hypothetical protein
MAEEGPRPSLVRVAIPHYWRPLHGREGHGSHRGEEGMLRAIALARCLGGVLALARGEREEILDIAAERIAGAPPPAYPARRLPGVWVDCHVFVNRDACQHDVLKAFERRITVHRLNLEDPMQLPGAARDFLLQDDAMVADLLLYMEDDLVIGDRLYADKLLWFCDRTQHHYTLMPHRYELTGVVTAPRLFVDGPIDLEYLRDFQEPREGMAQGRFWDGQEVRFDLASNPHSGSFALSRLQQLRLRQDAIGAKPFVGALETVATGTVLAAFPVVKPAWEWRDFLLLEHAHPSFLACRFRWPG